MKCVAKTNSNGSISDHNEDTRPRIWLISRPNSNDGKLFPSVAVVELK